jgi:hypothetical protein
MGSVVNSIPTELWYAFLVHNLCDRLSKGNSSTFEKPY